MNKMRLIILILLSSTILSAADSITAGYIAEEYKGQHLGKVMVKYNGSSLAIEKYIEEDFVRVFKEYDNVKPSAYINNFSPTKKFSDEEISSLLIKDGINKLLVISKSTDMPSGTTVYANKFSESRVIQEYYSITIYDLENNNKVIWIGDIYIWGKSTLADVRKHLIKYMLKLMERDGLIES